MANTKQQLKGEKKKKDGAIKTTDVLSRTVGDVCGFWDEVAAFFFNLDQL